VILIACVWRKAWRLGGEYGGGRHLRGEHSPHGKRGYYNLVHQPPATLGLFPVAAGDFCSPAPHSASRFRRLGLAHSFLVSVFCWQSRSGFGLRSTNAPVFQKMKDEGKGSKAPLTEAFANWSNAKIVILALIGGTMGQGVSGILASSTRCSFLQSISRSMAIPPTC